MESSAPLEDQEYFEKRAEAELKLAQGATDPCAVSAHYDLATCYLERIAERPEDRPAFPSLARQ